MNIRNRLEKLEKQNTAANSGFCACKKINAEVWQQDLTEETETTERHLLGDAVPDICPDCNKQIEKRVFILQLVDRESGKNFPEEINRETTRLQI